MYLKNIGIAALLLASCGPQSRSAAPRMTNGTESAEWRRIPPRASAMDAPSPLPVSSQRLSNGVRVLFVHRPAVPLVSFRFVALRTAAPGDAVAAASHWLLMTALEQQANSEGGLGIRERLDAIGGELVAEIGLESSAIFVDAPAEHVQAALDIGIRVITEPELGDQTVKPSIASLRSRLQRASSQGVSSALNTLEAQLFGSHGPYSYRHRQLLEALDTVSPSAVLAEHCVLWRPESVAVVVAGSFDEQKTLAALESALGVWRGGSCKRPPLHTPKTGSDEPRSLPQVVIVDSPDAAEVSLAMGTLVGCPSVEDWAGLEVLNEIFGGSYSSRVNLKLREELRVTYRARSAVVKTQSGCFMYLSADLQSDRVDEALQAIFEQMDDLREGRFADDELAGARTAAAYRPGRAFQSNREASAALQHMLGSTTELSDYLRLPALASQLPRETLVGVAERLLRKERFVIVLRGPYELVNAQLTKLGFSGVQRVQP